ncbi:hypothetical protein D3C75_869320 [compost metagenome]
MQNTPGHGVVLVNIYEILGYPYIGCNPGGKEQSKNASGRIPEKSVPPHKKQGHSRYGHNRTYRSVLLLDGDQDQGTGRKQGQQEIVIIPPPVEQ